MYLFCNYEVQVAGGYEAIHPFDSIEKIIERLAKAAKVKQVASFRFRSIKFQEISPKHSWPKIRKIIIFSINSFRRAIRGDKRLFMSPVYFKVKGIGSLPELQQKCQCMDILHVLC